MGKNSADKDKRMSIIEFIMGLITTLFISIFVSIFIEFLLMTFYRPENGANNSRLAAIAEMGYLHKDFASYVSFGMSPAGLANWFYELAYSKPYNPLDITDYYWLSKDPSDPIIVSIAKSIASIFSEYGLSMIYVIITLMARLAVLIFAIPLFLFAFVAGVTDGLVEREKRRWGGGTESGLTYHYSKRWIVRGYFGSWFIYMSMPFSIHPTFVLLPCSLFIAWVSYMCAWSFKKYF